VKMSTSGLIKALLITLLVSLTVLCGACGSSDKPAPAKPKVSLAEKLVEVREGLPMCDGITVFTDAYQGCHQPNGGLYHGLLCFSGEAFACEQMFRFIREDSLVKDPLHPDANHGGSGSRDELMGHLFYLLETADRRHADVLLNLIRSNGNKLCKDATDNRCEVTPAMWGLMRVVWNKLGWELTPNMVVGNVLDDSTLVLSAYTSPVGYQTHLIALSLLLRAKTDTWSAKCQKALEVILERHPTLFVRWLAGQDVSNELLRGINAPRADKVSSWAWENGEAKLRPTDHPASYLWLGNLIVHN
jgi:hypothetical protein